MDNKNNIQKDPIHKVDGNCTADARDRCESRNWRKCSHWLEFKKKRYGR